ncbi:CBS domain-containing protein [Alkalilimnicola ehrlichii MLHE-1]|uniref:Putative signal transduction protein with CBS domains n=1 Tax=Alkalilimnicola ehrlichii (strain ATCC BAA-1101 / DSM 17681 / MLHE-1) TaxID=187272 RepID=Q0A7V1_ALKEH|nr:CBS domain-containing protein [Alkalilimnicola ehrlichii]ABI57086.1 putative signal transduction protein with CBS domains [Alkalilimnicola ehrlichii MLHE-1]
MKVNAAMHRGVEWCAPDTPIMEIARLFREKDIGAIPIGENDRLVGMLTDRDIVCRGLAEGRDVASMTAGDVMTRDIIYCWEDDDIEDAVHLMEEHRVRRVPVLNSDKRMTGMLSMGDISHAANPELCREFLGAVAAHH